MIGLSLSFCVLDLVNGKVDWKDVDYIITSTNCPTVKAWLYVVDSYQETYWKECKFSAVGAATRLLDGGMIRQPRLLDTNHFPNLNNTGHWVESEDEIEWSDE